MVTRALSVPQLNSSGNSSSGSYKGSSGGRSRPTVQKGRRSNGAISVTPTSRNRDQQQQQHALIGPRSRSLINGMRRVSPQKQTIGSSGSRNTPVFLRSRENEIGSADTLEIVASKSTGSEPSTPEDNINVVVRVRPLNEKEKRDRHGSILQFPGNGQIIIESHESAKSRNRENVRVFTYNVVFEPGATQEDILNYSGIKRIIEMAIEGFSCTAFCYGQTGSGKTHTLTGPPDLFIGKPNPKDRQHGLIFRSFLYLFQLIRNRKDITFVLKASFMEIYNERQLKYEAIIHIHMYMQTHLRQLCTEHRMSNVSKMRLLVRKQTVPKELNIHIHTHIPMVQKSGGFFVENLFTVDCEELDDLLAVLEEGMRNRAVGSHAMNDHSSRSHTILTVHIISEQQTDGGVFLSKHGKINFVDLAGSELTKKTMSEGKTLEEANNINKSLMVLAQYNYAETLNTLRYASRAKRIRTKPVIMMDPREALILSLKRDIQSLQMENEHLKAALNLHRNSIEEVGAERPEVMEVPTDHGSIPKVNLERLPELDGSELAELVKLYMQENEALRQENNHLLRYEKQYSGIRRLCAEKMNAYSRNWKMLTKSFELTRTYFRKHRKRSDEEQRQIDQHRIARNILEMANKFQKEFGSKRSRKQ
ncbi:Kinesin-like protein KIF12 [Eumeta japonica]|uniref:Kinesin-like protein n=1 Tax=Eumeta variegata TaxID=151549 RepID=A0A4C1SAP3_EUMVA|nr:Kinesin-like protein KIF12 [Eumeta japonica]